MSTKNNNRIVQPYLFFEGRCEEAVEFYRKALGAEVTAADRHFAALAECGQVQVPLHQGPFSPRFGMVADRFGVSWMITVATPGQQ
jgi:PhnB protein